MRGTELKKEIRENVKTLGHRDLSVKYDGSYRVALKKFVPLSPIEKIAEKRESYQRCEATGDILQGGNTFVFVEYMRWDTNKDQAFSLEVPQEALDQAETALEDFYNSSWGGSDSSSRHHHLARKIAESCPFFSDWSAEDVSKGLSLLVENSEKISNWIHWKNMEFIK